MATRQSIKALNQSAVTVAKSAKAERDRKAASKAALKAAKAELQAEQPVLTQADSDSPTMEAIKSEQTKQRAEQDAINALATAKADAEATGVTFEEMLAEMGIDEHGHPLKFDTRYAGPMLALVSARKTYVKAENGILCNGDQLANICGAHTREETVKALITALDLPNNPYSALNPGQQSMNLRNKARHALKNGTLTIEQIKAAF